MPSLIKSCIFSSRYDVNFYNVLGIISIHESLQWSFSGLNTDGLFTKAVSNLFLSPLEKIPLMQIWDNFG